MAEVNVPAEMAESVAQMLRDWKPKKEKDKVKPCTGCYHLNPKLKIPCGLASAFCINSDNKPYWMNPLEGALERKL
jgi:hypothetical protein